MAHDVVAGVLIRDGHVLLCHRSPAREWYPDVWDLPGGHVEAAFATIMNLDHTTGPTVPA